MSARYLTYWNSFHESIVLKKYIEKIFLSIVIGGMAYQNAKTSALLIGIQEFFNAMHNVKSTKNNYEQKQIQECS